MHSDHKKNDERDVIKQLLIACSSTSMYHGDARVAVHTASPSLHCSSDALSAYPGSSGCFL